MYKVLIIDSDAAFAKQLYIHLVDENYSVEFTSKSVDGLKWLRNNSCDLVIVDEALPSISGVEVLIDIRKHSNIPIIMLTTNEDDITKVVELELGADDVIHKSCRPQELIARIRAIKRRCNEKYPIDNFSEIVIGPMNINLQSRTITVHQNTLKLTGVEFNIIAKLATNVGQIVAKEELSISALGKPLTRYDRSIDVHISHLRSKLGPRPDKKSWIQSVRGQGYQLSPL